MCGIFGYVGTTHNASQMVYDGLKRLDYRGYDSWGIATIADGTIALEKHAGKIGAIPSLLPTSTIAIGHTRWATHGSVSDINAHPHASTDNSFVLAQNGIVENYEELKKDLIANGYPFYSQTDTEVIVRLIEEIRKTTPDIREAIRTAFTKLKGRNTIIVLTKTNEIIVARNGSPLVIGIDTTKTPSEIYFSSDVLSFAPFANQMIVMENGQMAYVSATGELHISTITTGKEIKQRIETIDIDSTEVGKEGYDHFMMKEIMESPTVVRAVCTQPTELLNRFANAIKTARTVYCIGSGTAGAAAAQTAYYLRKYAHIPAIALIGAEAQEYIPLFQKGDMLYAPSQSGETADVLEILEIAKEKGVTIASYVNMPGSMMSRMSDFAFMAKAGPEMCVMSTKVFTSQIAFGYLLAQTVAGKQKHGEEELKKCAESIENYIAQESNKKSIAVLAQTLAKKPHIFLLSKGQNLQVIREGMVKIIEGAYVHAHAIPAGDLKHYAITLMEKGVPVLFMMNNDEVQGDIMSAVHEVKARGAEIIGCGSVKDSAFDHYLPIPDHGETSAIMNVVPLQLLAYYMSVTLGHDVDKPRNIAKSVTVK